MRRNHGRPTCNIKIVALAPTSANAIRKRLRLHYRRPEFRKPAADERTTDTGGRRPKAPKLSSPKSRVEPTTPMPRRRQAASRRNGARELGRQPRAEHAQHRRPLHDEDDEAELQRHGVQSWRVALRTLVCALFNPEGHVAPASSRTPAAIRRDRKGHSIAIRGRNRSGSACRSGLWKRAQP
jgi:hypothetical protein